MFSHPFPFDPTYGYSLEQLLAIQPPPGPSDFREFWEARYERAIGLDPEARIQPTHTAGPWQVADLTYRSTDGFQIGGWALLPRDGEIRAGVVYGHGYVNLEGPDYEIPLAHTAILVPCLRGMGRSQRPPISSESHWHVLHDIDKRERYIHGGCVEDLWLGVSALLQLFPHVAGKVGLIGVSFGGGIGAMALPWDARIERAHLEVPSFGHHPLRLTLPTFGSGAAVIAYEKRRGGVLETLRYYDAATAASSIRIPVHVAAARFDPAVAPPGQFAIYNALAGPKELFVLDAGHFDYPNQARQKDELRVKLVRFFGGF